MHGMYLQSPEQKKSWDRWTPGTSQPTKPIWRTQVQWETLSQTNKVDSNRRTLRLTSGLHKCAQICMYRHMHTHTKKEKTVLYFNTRTCNIYWCHPHLDPDWGWAPGYTAKHLMPRDCTAAFGATLKCSRHFHKRNYQRKTTLPADDIAHLRVQSVDRVVLFRCPPGCFDARLFPVWIFYAKPDLKLGWLVPA